MSKARAVCEKIRLTVDRGVWARIMYFAKEADGEISGMGITPKENRWHIEEFVLPKQECTAAHTEFDGTELAKLMDEYIVKGYEPWQTQRVWIHTHPGFSAEPSGPDWANFDANYVRDRDDSWGTMIVVNQKGEVSVNVWFGMLGAVMKGELVVVDREVEIHGEEWKKELDEKVTKPKSLVSSTTKYVTGADELVVGAEGNPLIGDLRDGKAGAFIRLEWAESIMGKDKKDWLKASGYKSVKKLMQSVEFKVDRMDNEMWEALETQMVPGHPLFDLHEKYESSKCNVIEVMCLRNNAEMIGMDEQDIVVDWHTLNYQETGIWLLMGEDLWLDDTQLAKCEMKAGICTG
jgi:proteasome lid subunit RPN8/RPN11